MSSEHRTSLATLRSRVFNHNFLTILKCDDASIQVLCTYCGKSFTATRTNHVDSHLSGSAHEKAVRLKVRKRKFFIKFFFFTILEIKCQNDLRLSITVWGGFLWLVLASTSTNAGTEPRSIT